MPKKIILPVFFITVFFLTKTLPVQAMQSAYVYNKRFVPLPPPQSRNVLPSYNKNIRPVQTKFFPLDRGGTIIHKKDEATKLAVGNQKINPYKDSTNKMQSLQEKEKSVFDYPQNTDSKSQIIPQEQAIQILSIFSVAE